MERIIPITANTILYQFESKSVYTTKIQTTAVINKSGKICQLYILNNKGNNYTNNLFDLIESNSWNKTTFQNNLFNELCQ